MVVSNWLIHIYKTLRWSACKRRCTRNKVQTDDVNENNNGTGDLPLNKMANQGNDLNEEDYGNILPIGMSRGKI